MNYGGDTVLGVYKITCLANSQFYIGSSCNVNVRISNHFNYLKNGSHPNPLLQCDFDKFGVENFVSEIFELCDNYLEREDYYITHLNPHYNIRQNGKFILSKEVIRKFQSNILIQSNGCWSYKNKTNQHYSCFRIDDKEYGCHRISYHIFNGAFDSYLKVLHRCNNKYCINPEHLFLGTDQDNRRDAHNNGIGCKLNKSIVQEIRNISLNKSDAEISEYVYTKYSIKIHTSHINRILNNIAFYDKDYIPCRPRTHGKEIVSQVRQDYLLGLTPVEISSKYDIKIRRVYVYVNNEALKDNSYAEQLLQFRNK